MKKILLKEYSITISSWTQRSLENIQAKTGIPFPILAESILIKGIYRELNLIKDKTKNARVKW